MKEGRRDGVEKGNKKINKIAVLARARRRRVEGR